MDRTSRDKVARAYGPAVGYTRVSREEQAREGVSLEAQRDRIAAYALAKDLELGEVLVDEGLSGKDLNRPALQDVLDRCRRGEVKHVIVWKLDRLTRCTRHLLSLVEDLFLARHIELHSVSESLDTSTPHGRFVLTLFGGLAQMERELIAERTRGALAWKRENGLPTSHPSLGFRTNGKRNHMIPVSEELQLVERILDFWRMGRSTRAIAVQLNAEGARTKQGARWHHTTVGKVVRRRDWYAPYLRAVWSPRGHVRADVSTYQAPRGLGIPLSRWWVGLLRLQCGPRVCPPGCPRGEEACNEAGGEHYHAGSDQDRRIMRVDVLMQQRLHEVSSPVGHAYSQDRPQRAERDSLRHHQPGNVRHLGP